MFGHPLSAELTGSGPQPIGCQQANFTNDDIYSIAMDVANNEIAHVNYLRTALGNYSVQCPLVNIGDAFAAAADAALGTTLSPPFVPYTNDLYFLTGAFIFEDLGVTAYKGALTSFQSSDIMLAAAGRPTPSLPVTVQHPCLACSCLACSSANKLLTYIVFTLTAPCCSVGPFVYLSRLQCPRLQCPRLQCPRLQCPRLTCHSGCRHHGS